MKEAGSRPVFPNPPDHCLGASILTRIFPLILAFGVAAGSAWLLLRERLSRWVLDHPNQRSLHGKPVPRTGGVAILLGVLAGWAWGGGIPWGLVVPVLVLTAVSLWDDVRGLPVRLRLTVHVLAAVGLLWLLPSTPHAVPWALLAVAGMVWAINLYNFMDGSDGLAGGMALFGFGWYGLVAAAQGGEAVAAASLTVAAAAAAFLLFNFPPARMFMGDAGSIPLGFLSAALGWLGWRENLWPLWFPLMVFSPFFADASVTLVKRGLRGERVWQAHREHYYQRLVMMGWGHRKVALGAYLLMAAAGASAWWGLSLSAGGRYALLAGWVLIYGTLMIRIDRDWARHTSREGGC